MTLISHRVALVHDVRCNLRAGEMGDGYHRAGGTLAGLPARGGAGTRWAGQTQARGNIVEVGPGAADPPLVHHQPWGASLIPS